MDTFPFHEINDKASSDFAIDIHDLCKSFNGKMAVDHVTLQIKPGEIFGFLGPNGSGKTTTIRMLCGLLTPDCGYGQCLGYDIQKQSRDIKKQVGYMTQSFSLYHDLTPRENLEFIGRIYGIENLEQAIDQTLQELGFSQEHLKKLTRQLSGGWKQRLALASAILPHPKILLLDEPTSGVDPKARRDFWEEIHRLSHQGVTVLVSTHYMDEAAHCHRLAYIANGSLLATGSVDEIVEQSGLTVLVATGKGLLELTQRLRTQPGVEQATMFGEKLHLIGHDSKALKTAIQPYLRSTYVWEQSRPTLEDIFLNLVAQTERNRTQENDHAE